MASGERVVARRGLSHLVRGGDGPETESDFSVQPPTAHLTLPAPGLGEDEGRPALLVDGVVQSVAFEAAEHGYWAAMVPDVRPNAALLLGLGAGTVVHLLTRRFGPLPVVGVDDDPRVVELARAELGLGLPHLKVVVQDAFVYVAQHCRSERSARPYDYICVDLFRGADMPRGVLARPFLRQLRALLRPRGLLVFNLFHGRRTPQQVRRLGEVFRVLRAIRVAKNVVVHCRA